MSHIQVTFLIHTLLYVLIEYSGASFISESTPLGMFSKPVSTIESPTTIRCPRGKHPLLYVIGVTECRSKSDVYE